MDFDHVLRAFEYNLPSELIAKEPVSPRDSARLLIYDRKTDSVQFDTFANIDKYLPRNSVLVFNQTKVLPAKFILKKDTGGKVEALYLSTNNESITVLASGKLKAGDRLLWEGGRSFEVISRTDQEAVLHPNFTIEKFRSLLEAFGQTPLPPYMKDSPLDEQRRRSEYQTTFAKVEGSVAAPTAGLHFTESLIKKLEQSGHTILFVTLHVNLGTFASLTEEQWQKKKLHTEWYSIDKKTISALEEAKKSGKKIVAVGTTTVRTLESASDGEVIESPTGTTDLFLTEDSPLHFVDSLITNFHVPRSSLLMLVSAFTGRQKLLDLYGQATLERMRFFSFGDGMLIL